MVKKDFSCPHFINCVFSDAVQVINCLSLITSNKLLFDASYVEMQF
jgi:hypothetical protein